MATTFPDSYQPTLLESAMADTTDLYEVKTGKGETRGYGSGVRLFWIQTDHNEAINTDLLEVRNERNSQLDPQPPHLLTYEELVRAALSLDAANKQREKERTEEFEELTGLRDSKAA